MSELQELVDSAISELRDWHKNNPGDTEPHDAIFEISDSSVPVYTGNLLELASDNWELMTNEPELGPAFDGSPTPINIIAANIFEHIESALWEAWQEIKDEVLIDPDESYEFNLWIHPTNLRWFCTEPSELSETYVQSCDSFWESFNTIVSEANDLGLNHIDITWDDHEGLLYDQPSLPVE